MMLIDAVSKSSISLQLLQTSFDSSAYTSSDSSCVHKSSQVRIINHFEHAVKKLIQALKKIDTRNKYKDVKLKTTKHIEAEKSKI